MDRINTPKFQHQILLYVFQKNKLNNKSINGTFHGPGDSLCESSPGLPADPS